MKSKIVYSLLLIVGTVLLTLSVSKLIERKASASCSLNSNCSFTVEDDYCAVSWWYECPYCQQMVDNDRGRCCHIQWGYCINTEPPDDTLFKYCDEYCSGGGPMS